MPNTYEVVRHRNRMRVLVSRSDGDCRELVAAFGSFATEREALVAIEQAKLNDGVVPRLAKLVWTLAEDGALHADIAERLAASPWTWTLAEIRLCDRMACEAALCGPDNDFELGRYRNQARAEAAISAVLANLELANSVVVVDDLGTVDGALEVQACRLRRSRSRSTSIAD